jgi:D-alanyl-D-alanine carboxypeptidase
VWLKRNHIGVFVCTLTVLFMSPVSGNAKGLSTFRVERLDALTRKAMTGVVWDPGCPVSLDDLRSVVVPFVDFSGATQEGRLVVHRDAANAVGDVFSGLFVARFPIAKIEPIEAYGGDDDLSTLDNNTSAFNCRRAVGATGTNTKRWSQHAYGRAVDVNPLQNPYVRANGTVLDPNAERFLDRKLTEPGMAVRGGTLVSLFATHGWKWGGNWRASKDYQHFSVTGK